MNIEFQNVNTNNQIEVVSLLANKIWPETYDSLNSAAHTQYMLNKLQSVPAIRSQIDEQHYQYYLINFAGADVGYFAVVPNHKNQGDLFLSKLYLLSKSRRNGIIRNVFTFLFDKIDSESFQKIWLTVNKRNTHAASVYKHFGFEITDSIVTDIGSGYVMDDYVFTYSKTE